MAITVEQALAQAEREVRQLVEDYPAHISKTLDDIQGHAENKEWRPIYVMAHDIKGQAATVGWPVLGAMAASLQESLRSNTEALYGESVRLHVAGMRLCLANKVVDIDDGENARLLGDLRRLTHSMHERDETKAGL